MLAISEIQHGISRSLPTSIASKGRARTVVMFEKPITD